MAITIKKYVDITSGVGAGVLVKVRELIGRLFTTNPLLPTKSYAEFTSATEVGEYFGTDSVEYLRALFYFSFISKSITKPTKISFARWANAATLPTIFGYVAPQSVSSWTGITDGAFSLKLGATTNVFSALDFSGATTLANVASIIQTAIRTKTGAMWTAATVTYDPARGSFNFNGGVAGDAVIAATAPVTGTNILANGLLGWTADGIFSNGAALESATDTIINSAAASTNFGSFLFIPALTLEQVTDIAQWNAAENVSYMFTAPVLAADATTYFAALKNYSGTALTESSVANEYPEMAPMIVLAATDYARRDSVQNYMFQQFALTPGVASDAVSNQLDAVRVNYYGRTQTAGQNIDFYQRGVLMGLATDPVDMNVYANEQWLKDDAAAALMTMLLNAGRVQANAEGRAKVLETLQNTIDKALFNGVISVGKTLNTQQKLYIASVSGNPNAWHQVEGIGYWVDCTIVPVATTDGRTEYKAVYLLINSKDDAIRKVEGTHTLI